jgi:hypothetical protein
MKCYFDMAGIPMGKICSTCGALYYSTDTDCPDCKARRQSTIDALSTLSLEEIQVLKKFAKQELDKEKEIKRLRQKLEELEGEINGTSQKKYI